MEFKKNENYTLTITDIGTNGEGIGKIDNFTVFVEQALPGEEVEIKMTKVNKSYGYGKLLNIIKPSPERIAPPCPIAKRCGGCNIQHLSYEAQLEYKKNKVYQNLKRIGGFEAIEVKDTIGMSNPFNYRNKSQYPVSRTENDIIFGFYANHSHNIIACEDCKIGSDKNTEILEKIKNFMLENNIKAYDEKSHTGLIRHILIRVGSKTNDIMVCLVINSTKFKYKTKLVTALADIEGIKSIVLNYNTAKTNVILGDEVETIFGDSFITDYIADLKFEISPLSFYQVNPVQTEKLYSTALEYANLTNNEVVIDAYCGIGTISLFLSKRAKKVYGIEVVAPAIEDAKKNAELNNIKNTEFIVGKAEEIIPKLYEDEGITPDVIVVDPPRKGCDTALLETMLKMSPKRIVYVSCDSATLARDLKILCTSNEYKIEKVQPVDMFPQTVHVESVVLLNRKE